MCCFSSPGWLCEVSSIFGLAELFRPLPEYSSWWGLTSTLYINKLKQAKILHKYFWVDVSQTVISIETAAFHVHQEKQFTSVLIKDMSVFISVTQCMRCHEMVNSILFFFDSFMINTFQMWPKVLLIFMNFSRNNWTLNMFTSASPFISSFSKSKDIITDAPITGFLLILMLLFVSLYYFCHCLSSITNKSSL